MPWRVLVGVGCLTAVAADRRTRADARVLGHDVLPLRVPGDLHRHVRPERQRRVRLRHADAGTRRPAARAARALRDGVLDPGAAGGRRCLLRINVGTEYSGRNLGLDAGDLPAGGAAVRGGRRRRHHRGLAAARRHRARLRGRPGRRRRRVPAAHPDAQRARRRRRHPVRGVAGQRWAAACFAGAAGSRVPAGLGSGAGSWPSAWCGRPGPRGSTCTPRRAGNASQHHLQQVELVLPHRGLQPAPP